MAGEGMPKWQRQLEAILMQKFQGDELQEKLKEVNKLISFIPEIEVPTGDAGEVVAAMLRAVSQGLRPLAAVYAGFQLGIAFERLQNARQS